MAKIKGLIFDLDGTIIDNNDVYMESMLKRVGKDIGQDLGLRHAQELWYSIGAMSRDEVIARWGIDPDQFWLAFNKFESLDEKLKNTYIHLDALALKKLNMPMGIVTHTSLEHTTRLLELVGMRSYFDSDHLLQRGYGLQAVAAAADLLRDENESGLRRSDVHRRHRIGHHGR